MTDSYEEYVQPPSYKDSAGSDDDPLIAKLRLRIQQDLNQINGVYDSRIKDAEERKRKRLLEAEAEFVDVTKLINKQRSEDISVYNEKAERHIDSLISTMNNSPQQMVMGWWEKLFGL